MHCAAICACLALRSADNTQSPSAARKETTAMPPISNSQIMVGIERADIARRRKAAGLRCAHADPHGAAMATRHTRASAGIEFLPPACQFLSAITHPRICGRSVWLDGFGSGKRLPLQPENVTQITAIALT